MNIQGTGYSRNLPITWQEEKTDRDITGIQVLMERLDTINALKLIASSQSGPLILIDFPCWQGIKSHVNSGTEQAGLLIGDVYSLQYAPKQKYRFVAFITGAIPSIGGKSTATSVSMDAQIWHRAACSLNGSKIVVGWYHSHPGFGAFFSGTDRLTQNDVFIAPYMLAMVIDPVKEEVKWFHGRQAEEIETARLVSIN